MKSAVFAIAAVLVAGPTTAKVLPAVSRRTKAKSFKSSKNAKARKCPKPPNNPLGFDPIEWKGLDVVAKKIDDAYHGQDPDIFLETNSDVSDFADTYKREGAVFTFDLGSFSSLTRRLGSVIVLAQIRSIWHALSPIAGEHDGVIMKSIGDSLLMYFEKVLDGLMATRVMYLAVVQRWKDQVALACEGDSPPEAWCEDRTEEDERKRFFNTGAMGGGFGNMILVGPPEDGTLVDVIGGAVNNAFFAGEEEAEHGETIIDKKALESLLIKANSEFVVECNVTIEIP